MKKKKESIRSSILPLWCNDHSLPKNVYNNPKRKNPRPSIEIQEGGTARWRVDCWPPPFLPPLPYCPDRALLTLRAVLLFNGCVEAKGRKGGDKRAVKPSRRRRRRWDNGKGWREKGTFEEREERVGRKVWREKNLLLLLGCWTVARIDTVRRRWLSRIGFRFFFSFFPKDSLKLDGISRGRRKGDGKIDITRIIKIVFDSFDSVREVRRNLRRRWSK